MENSAGTPSVMPPRCPYLGVHDDRFTSLAYPSPWNYCYRADPPASVLTSYQEKVCLTSAYQRCPVFLRVETAPLPAGLRGTHSVPSSSHRARNGMIAGIILLFGLVAAAVFLAPRFPQFSLIPMVPSSVVVLPTGTASAVASATKEFILLNPADMIVASFTADALTRVANFTPTSTVTITGTLPTPTKSPTLTRTPSQTPKPTQTHTPTATSIRVPTSPQASASSLTPLPISAGACGYALDTLFGGTVKFLLHRIQSGESLAVLADRYHTTTRAIIAVNYHLPLPVWADWVVVIPDQTADVEGIPPFESYQAVNLKMTLDELAHQLGVDAQTLQTYNNFQPSCNAFSGWLLVPRSNP